MPNVIIYGVAVDDFPKSLTTFNVIDTVEYSPSLTMPIEYDENVDLIYCMGGDGSLLGAEHLFPGIPKLPIRSEKRYIKCEKHKIENFIKKFEREFDTLEPKKLLKIQCSHIRSELSACAEGLNDITLRNADQRTAIRFDVYVNGIKYNPNPVVGDGIVAATPFGSSGYYRSLTKAFFSSGLGIGFNNTTEPIDNLVLPEDSHVEIRMLRGVGMISSDNNPNMIEISKGDRLIIKRSHNSGKVWVFGLDNLYCCNCKETKTGLPGGRRHPSFK